MMPSVGQRAAMRSPWPMASADWWWEEFTGSRILPPSGAKAQLLLSELAAPLKPCPSRLCWFSRMPAGEAGEELALASLPWTAVVAVGAWGEVVFLRRISARLELFLISTLWATSTFFPAS